MDVLAQSLRSLQLKTEVYGRLELSAPWGLDFDLGLPGFFHAVTRGSCLLEVGRKRLALSAGDWVFILGGTPHVLRDSPRSRTRRLPDIYSEHRVECGGVLHHGGTGPGTTLVSFSFGFSGDWLNPVLAGLPPVLHVRADGIASSRWVDSTIQLVAAEMEAGRPGHEVVATRMAESLFVYALRTHVETSPLDGGGWLRALEHPQLGRVLEQIHQRPQASWSVASMARSAGMSRSAFAALFRRILGEGPLGYLTRWRMHTAIQLMGQEDQSLAAIAEAVGYESDAAFGKAFKRHVGKGPGAYRRELRGEAA